MSNTHPAPMPLIASLSRLMPPQYLQLGMYVLERYQHGSIGRIDALQFDGPRQPGSRITVRAKVTWLQGPSPSPVELEPAASLIPILQPITADTLPAEWLSTLRFDSFQTFENTCLGVTECPDTGKVYPYYRGPSHLRQQLLASGLDTDGLLARGWAVTPEVAEEHCNSFEDAMLPVANIPLIRLPFA